MYYNRKDEQHLYLELMFLFTLLRSDIVNNTTVANVPVLAPYDTHTQIKMSEDLDIT